MIVYHQSKKKLSAHKMVLQSAVHEVFSLPIRGLERLADNNIIPWNLPTIFHPDQIAEVSRMFLFSHCVLPVLRCHLSQNEGGVEVQ